MSLRAAYEQACETPSDIYEHLPRLRAAAMDADKVIELGTRGGVSTIALLAGLELSGGNLYSVDIDPAPDFDHDQWTFVQGDDCDPAIYGELPNGVDVVFIDTSHMYDHTLRELRLYRWKVKPGGVILLHDTNLECPIGWDARQPRFPVRAAVEVFCAEEGLTPTFALNCFGLGEIPIPE